ncbi:MAG: chalcone isomerase family protein [Deltaproteobacteria bacterium]|nr:chalcone isomerase family protein [Deltaproteobacteria bacterium]
MSPARSLLLAAAFVGLAWSGAAVAKTVDGVDFPDTVEVAGAKLVRNGIGARTVMFMRFYLAALYVEKAASTASTLLGPDRPREVRLVMVKEVSKARFQEAAQAGFDKNTPTPSAELKAKEAQFLALVPGQLAGDTLTFSYEPGVGTHLKGSKVKETVIAGKDFADALFAIWLGEHPVDDGLKKGLLGKDSL